MKKVWFYWVLWAVIITIFSGLVYAAVQQNYRQNGNDPQIEIAEDTASALAQGAQLQDVIPNGNVDAAKSLAPFAIITDSSGKVLASDVVVNSSIETIPSGAYSTAKSKGENRITWQPQKRRPRCGRNCPLHCRINERIYSSRQVAPRSRKARKDARRNGRARMAAFINYQFLHALAWILFV